MAIGVYIIKFSGSEKVYVGSSINIDKRRSQHFWLLEHNRSHSPKLQNAYNKRGKNSITFEVIEICEQDRLRDRELYWIIHFNAVKKGYNCTDDVNVPCRGYKWNDASKLRASIAQKKAMDSPIRKAISSAIIIEYNKSRKGFPKSKNHRLNIGLASKGKVRTEEQNKAQSERVKANPISHWKGKVRSIEDRKKMSSSHIGMVNSAKPIISYDLVDKKITKYNSATDAARILGISRSAIKNNLRGFSKSCNKKTFQYATN